MKIGVIIVFHNNEANINAEELAFQINRAHHLKICLVNNYSKDNTKQLLYDVKEKCTSDVTILNTNKFKSDMSALRIGATYMIDTLNFSCVGYISAIFLNTKYRSLSHLIWSVNKNREYVLRFHEEAKVHERANASLVDRLFSVVQCLEQKKARPRFLSIQY